MKLLIYLTCLNFLLSLTGHFALIKNNESSSQSPTARQMKIPVPASSNSLIVNAKEDLPGYWVGWFSGFSEINISIDEISEKSIKGHTVLAGKIQFFTSEITETGSKYAFAFKGSSNDDTVGAFTFDIIKGDSVIRGKWTPGGKTYALGYALTKRLFKYNAHWKLTSAQYANNNTPNAAAKSPDDIPILNNDIYSTTTANVYNYNPSEDVLTKKYLTSLKRSDLVVLRNSIFARHGYTFKKPMLNYYFSRQPWYVPLNNDVTSQLTAIETKNIALMASYEKNLVEY